MIAFAIYAATLILNTINGSPTNQLEQWIEPGIYSGKLTRHHIVNYIAVYPNNKYIYSASSMTKHNSICDFKQRGRIIEKDGLLFFKLDSLYAEEQFIIHQKRDSLSWANRNVLIKGSRTSSATQTYYKTVDSIELTPLHYKESPSFSTIQFDGRCFIKLTNTKEGQVGLTNQINRDSLCQLIQ